jgi:hypothetical protein
MIISHWQNWITDLKNDILCSERVYPQAAWRIAVKACPNIKKLYYYFDQWKRFDQFFSDFGIKN